MRAVTRRPGPDRPHSIGRHPLVQQVLLALGVLAPIYYVVVSDVVAATRYPGYDRLARPVSELSAMTNGRGSIPRPAAVATAMGNMNTAAALLLISSVSATVAR